MIAARGRFAYIETPPTVYHAGRTLPLAKLQAKLLARLVSAEFVTVAELMAVGVKTPNSLRAQLSTLRHKLPAGCTLVNAYAKDYHLSIP